MEKGRGEKGEEEEEDREGGSEGGENDSKKLGGCREVGGISGRNLRERWEMNLIKILCMKYYRIKFMFLKDYLNVWWA